MVEFTCECGCGGVPREEDVEIGIRTAAGDVVPLGVHTHTPGHIYAKPDTGGEWVARHPGGQWVPLVHDGEVTG